MGGKLTPGKPLSLAIAYMLGAFVGLSIVPWLSSTSMAVIATVIGLLAISQLLGSAHMRLNAGMVLFTIFITGITVSGLRGLGPDSGRLGASATVDVMATARTWLISMLDRTSLEHHSAFLQSILLGGNASRLQPVSMEFSKVGISHILSVSGLHVGFVVLLVNFICKRLNLPNIIAGVINLFAIVFYSALCGWQAPILRASLMLIFVTAGTWLGRKGKSLNGLALATVIIISINPYIVKSVSFQLSFGAALSLVLLTPAIKAFIPLKQDRHPILTYLADSITISLAATIGTLPIIAYHFGVLSLLSPISNIVAVPLSGAIVILGILQVLLGAMFLPLGAALGATNGLLIDGLMTFAHTMATIPGFQLSLNLNSPLLVGLVMAGLYYAALESLQGYFPDSKGRGRARALLMLLACFTVLCFNSFVLVRGSGPSVTFISVGQGDSALIESGDGSRVLLDSGPASYTGNYPDAGQRKIIPFLRRRGISRLDAIILTHSDLDHIGGAGTIIKSIPVGAIIRNSDSGDTKASRELGIVEDDKNIPVYIADQGDSIKVGKDIHIDFLWPPKGLDDSTDTNDGSLVAKVYTDYHSVLMTGDATIEVEKQLIETSNSNAQLDSDVLKVGHHGSKSSTSDDLLKSVSPDIAVISVGPNGFGHPHKDVITRLESQDCRIYRTDKSGNIRVALGPGDLNVRTESR